jgi:hypothetical protein
MIKFYTLLLLIVGYCFALNDVTKPYNFAPRDTLKASKFNANYDTLYSRINQNNDSVDIGFIRWYDLNSHDSTLRYFKVDTITAKIIKADSITVTKGVKIGAGARGSTATPYKLDLGNTFSNSTNDTSCKIILYRDDDVAYGFGVGSNKDIQYHSDGTHDFYVKDKRKVRIDSTGLQSDSIKLGTGSYLKTYVEGSLPCTLKTSDVTVEKVGTINYTVVGNKVTLKFPFIWGTSKSPLLRLYCGGLTGILNPGSKFSASIPFLVDNAVSISGCNVIYLYGSGDYFLFNLNNESFTSSGSKGIGHWLHLTKTNIEYIRE